MPMPLFRASVSMTCQCLPCCASVTPSASRSLVARVSAMSPRPWPVATISVSRAVSVRHHNFTSRFRAVRVSVLPHRVSALPHSVSVASHRVSAERPARSSAGVSVRAASPGGAHVLPSQERRPRRSQTGQSHPAARPSDAHDLHEHEHRHTGEEQVRHP